jgi:cell division protein FtsZ
MTLNLRMPEVADLKPRITVFGVGGAGGNAVNNMIEQDLEGVEFVVANTDAQALQQNKADNRIQLGEKVTEGLGAGAKPAVGAAAAEESIELIVDCLAGSHMCFITAGMGGGTGTGAAPIIAQTARELGILTVGVVTKPFQFEGVKRMRQAEDGVEALQKVVDTLIIIPNQNLFRIANEKTTFTEAFALADDVLYQGTKGVTDLMVRPGLINLDFADIRAVMDEMGKAMMGTGEANGEDRAIQAAEKAIANPLLDEISLEGARGVLINITGGHDLTLFELDEAANRIREKVDPEANIIVGSTLDTSLEGAMRVSVVATGIDVSDRDSIMPVPRRPMKTPLPLSTADMAPAEKAEPEHVAEPVAEEAHPVVMESPAEPAPVEQTPVAQQETTEPTLFDDFAQTAETNAAETNAGDDLPPPAYRPEERTVQPSPVTVRANPSAETLARLHAAVSKVPAEDGFQRPAPRAEARVEEEKPTGFRLKNMISKMTGQRSDRFEELAEARKQPSVSHHNFDRGQPVEEEDEGENVEIPAFLRRQAN